MKYFYFKVLTLPKSAPIKITQCLPSEAAARQEALELYVGTGQEEGAWVKVYVTDPDDHWAMTPTPFYEIPGVSHE